MDDPTRGLLGSSAPDGPQELEARPGTAAGPSDRPATSDAPRPGPDAKFVGDAMRALYRTSSASIERGDATRVIGRAESVRPAPSTPPPAHKAPISSVPPGPRVDLALWVVLALGLFAIAGVMLSGAL